MSDDLIREVSKRLQFNLAAYGTVWTGENEDTRFLCSPILDRLARAEEERDKWEALARRFYNLMGDEADRLLGPDPFESAPPVTPEGRGR